MGHALMVKYALLAVVAFNLIGVLTGCKPEEDAKRIGQEMTRDSPGWERLRQQDALPPEKRDKGGLPADFDPMTISREWRVKKEAPTAPPPARPEQ